HVASKRLVRAVHAVDGSFHTISGFLLAQVAQHQHSGKQDGGGIGEVAPCDVRGRTVDRLEDGAAVAEVRARHQAQPTHKGRAQVGDDVAVQVLEQQRVVLVGMHHQLHAGVIYDVLAVGDLRIFLRYIARAAQEEPVREFHDIGLVDGVDLSAS